VASFIFAAEHCL